MHAKLISPGHTRDIQVSLRARDFKEINADETSRVIKFVLTEFLAIREASQRFIRLLYRIVLYRNKVFYDLTSILLLLLLPQHQSNSIAPRTASISASLTTVCGCN